MAVWLLMRASTVVGRIAVRTGASLWRHRIALLGAAVLVSAFSVYEMSFAVPTVTNGDCADTAMAAVTRVDDATARAAYSCLGPQMRTTSEDQFVTGMRQRSSPGGEVNRVADKRTSDGGHIVFFTVQASQGSAVGYIVYLDPQGKVARVE
jgi:hypothetical protein